MPRTFRGTFRSSSRWDDDSRYWQDLADLAWQYERDLYVSEDCESELHLGDQGWVRFADGSLVLTGSRHNMAA